MIPITNLVPLFVFTQSQSTEPVHLDENRPGTDDLKKRYTIDENLIEQRPNNIILFDDVMTTGAHFKAAICFMRDISKR